ncbi:leupaxin isoform X2 [Nematostella vectensis]|uniref:leupaxin isoform X2 n=1 Tax=Nematostella vectensis TaxID=45351 RepID=UPI002076E3E3|nr:leupaxin isoform X2 [Nematostella vectensis]
MDDLDALLADLQASSPAAVGTRTQATNGRGSPESPPPPLPPPPDFDALEQDNSHHHHHGKEELPPPPPLPDLTTPSNTTSTVLAANLSELDSLLEDLGKPQYPSTESPTKARISNPSPRASDVPQRVVANGRPSNTRPSVDAMLSDLDSHVMSPPPTSPHHQTSKPMQASVAQVHQPMHSQAQYHNPGPANGTPGRTASTATKELDDLMASLSDFKVNVSGAQSPTLVTQVSHVSQVNQGGPARHSGDYAKPQKQKTPSGSAAPSVGKVSQLDNMLGSLQSDMTRQGVSTTKKGMCAACNKPIIGQVCTALGKTWHPEHFACVACEAPLGTQNFFERDGKPYCERDYHDTFAPRCAYCNGPILDSCVTALDQTWHPKHFVCAECGNPFGDTGFHERDGKPFCRGDYYAMFAPRCGGCGQPIMDNYISALSAHWHAECFICTECRQPFPGGSFFDHDGRPYCEMHYHAKRGTLCYSCQKPITGRCITAMHRKFHPEHFVCAFCLKQLNKGTFKEQNDKPYCHPCFVKLFG